MKRITLVFAALMLVANTFAIDANEVSAKVKTSFEKNFSAASDVKWEKSNAIYFGSFKMDGQDVSVVYNEDGELKSSSRKMPLSNLPLKVLLSLKDRYAGYNIDNSVSEVFSNNETKYYIKAENAKNELSLSADASGDFTVENKVKKG